MRHLVLYCHPDSKSFCHAILENVVETLRGKGHEVRVKDLYAEGFDPILKGSDFAAFQAGKTPPDIKAEQDHIVWAETITVIHPVWWTSLPAMLKGYIDRVFALGFAYAFGPDGPKGLLGGRKVVIFSTQGAAQRGVRRFRHDRRDEKGVRHRHLLIVRHGGPGTQVLRRCNLGG